MRSLSGKVALVTGGTSGIGKATVELFVAEGAKVLFTGRNAAEGCRIEEGCGGAAMFFPADVLHEDDIQSSVAQTVSAFGSLDILFNNAGSLSPGDIEDITMDDFRYAMDLLVGSTVFCTKHAVPHMKKRGWGRIINNSSVAAIRTHFGGYSYSIAKAAVSHQTRMAGVALGPYGITVNAVLPGAVATPVFWSGSKDVKPLENDERLRKLQKLSGNLSQATPAKRAGQPVDVAHVVAFLASDAASFVNCQEIAVDGGMSACGRDRFDTAPDGVRPRDHE